MKVEKIKAENVSGKLELPIKQEQCQPGRDSVQPLKRRRLRRHDAHVGEACGKSDTKQERLALHSFWLKLKQEVKEEAQSMNAKHMKEGGFKGRN